MQNNTEDKVSYKISTVGHTVLTMDKKSELYGVCSANKTMSTNEIPYSMLMGLISPLITIEKVE
jgi:hypothetical protein